MGRKINEELELKFKVVVKCDFGAYVSKFTAFEVHMWSSWKWLKC